MELVKLGDGEPGESVYGEGASKEERATARGTWRGERRDAEGGEWGVVVGEREDEPGEEG